MGAALYARAALGILAGVAASLLPWPESASSSASGGVGEPGAVALLAPRGVIRGVPSRVVWLTAVPARRVRLRIVDDLGESLVERSPAIDPGRRELLLALAAPERARLERAGAGRVELALMASSGELLALAPPARFTLRPPEPVDGW